MTFTIDLSGVPPLCWLWAYLLLSYFVLGPFTARHCYEQTKDDVGAVILWAVAPIGSPVYLLLSIAYWWVLRGKK
jgi:hypothetical protein